MPIVGNGKKSQQMTHSVGKNNPVYVSLVVWCRHGNHRGISISEIHVLLCLQLNRHACRFVKIEWYSENNQSQKMCQTRDASLKGLSQIYIFLKQKQTNKKGLKGDNKNV